MQRQIVKVTVCHCPLRRWAVERIHTLAVVVAQEARHPHHLKECA